MRALKGLMISENVVLWILAVMLGYVSWTGRTWIDGIDQKVSVSDSRIDGISPRLTKLETEEAIKWPMLDQRLTMLEKKLDIQNDLLNRIVGMKKDNR